MSDDNCPPGNQPETDYNAAWSQDNISWSTITFNLDDPEGERRLRECLDAPKVKAAVRELEEWLKRQSDSENPEYAYAIDMAREKLFDIFNARGLDPWCE